MGVRDIVCNPQFKESASQNVSPKTIWKPQEISRMVAHSLIFVGVLRFQQNENPKDLRK